MQIQGTACRLRNGGDGGGGVLTHTPYSLLPPPSYWQCILSGTVWYGECVLQYTSLYSYIPGQQFHKGWPGQGILSPIAPQR